MFVQTGFTRVLARPQGVLSQSRPAATESSSLAVLSLGSNLLPSVRSRGQLEFGRESAFRFDWLLSTITARRSFYSGRRCDLRGAVDPTPCSTFLIPLAAPVRLSQPPTGPFRRTTRVAAIESPVQEIGFSGSLQADSATTRSLRVAIAFCGHRRFSDGHARPSPASEQVRTSRTVTSHSTRNSQRVPHEKRNARQRPAAGREPHRHC